MIDVTGKRVFVCARTTDLVDDLVRMNLADADFCRQDLNKVCGCYAVPIRAALYDMATSGNETIKAATAEIIGRFMDLFDAAVIANPEAGLSDEMRMDLEYLIKRGVPIYAADYHAVNTEHLFKDELDFADQEIFLKEPDWAALGLTPQPKPEAEHLVPKMDFQFGDRVFDTDCGERGIYICRLEEVQATDGEKLGKLNVLDIIRELGKTAKAKIQMDDNNAIIMYDQNYGTGSNFCLCTIAHLEKDGEL